MVFSPLLYGPLMLVLRMLVLIVYQLVGLGGRIYLEYTDRYIVEPVKSGVECCLTLDKAEVDEIDKHARPKALSSLAVCP